MRSGWAAENRTRTAGALLQSEVISTSAGACHPRCPACDGPAVPCRSAVRGHALHVCPACRVELLYPQPDESELAAIYSDHYFLGEKSEEAAERRSRMKSATGALYVDALARLIRRGNAKLLEIGCGHGEVLLEARERGFAVSGVEVSPHAAAVANRRLGAQTVQVGPLEEVAFPLGHFDAILAADVIEHVRDPKGFLQRAHALLSPGGVVMLITPSLDSWTRRLLRSRWMEYKVEHLYYFSARSIRSLLARCGFGEIRIFPNRKVLTFDYLARHFERFPVPFVSPLLGILRRAAPDGLAYRHVRLPASGLIAAGRKTPVNGRDDTNNEVPGL